MYLRSGPQTVSRFLIRPAPKKGCPPLVYGLLIDSNSDSDIDPGSGSDAVAQPGGHRGHVPSSLGPTGPEKKKHKKQKEKKKLYIGPHI